MNAITFISQDHWIVEENEILSAENIKLKQEIIHLKSTAQSLIVTLLMIFNCLCILESAERFLNHYQFG